jgi:hypothetical protein
MASGCTIPVMTMSGSKTRSHRSCAAEPVFRRCIAGTSLASFNSWATSHFADEVDGFVSIACRSDLVLVEHHSARLERHCDRDKCEAQYPGRNFLTACHPHLRTRLPGIFTDQPASFPVVSSQRNLLKGAERLCGTSKVIAVGTSPQLGKFPVRRNGWEETPKDRPQYWRAIAQLWMWHCEKHRPST